MALGRNGNYIYMYLGYVCNVFYEKKENRGHATPGFLSTRPSRQIPIAQSVPPQMRAALVGTENEVLGPNLARYGSRMRRK